MMKKFKLSDICPCSSDFDQYPESVRDGIRFLLTADFSAIPNGKSPVDGDRIYINVLQYQSHAPETVVVEKHENYIDIQYVIYGREYMAAVEFDGTQAVKVPYDEKIDMALYEPASAMPFFWDGSDSPCRFVVEPDEFLIFTTNDLHGSQIYIDEPIEVRKVIVKCRV